MTQLPGLVAQIVMSCNGFLVGGAANPEVTEPRDYDIIIPIDSWFQAAQLIPKTATVNTFGGWKFKTEAYTVDIWPEGLNILTTAMSKYIWHPRSGKRWTAQ